MNFHEWDEAASALLLLKEWDEKQLNQLEQQLLPSQATWKACAKRTCVAVCASPPPTTFTPEMPPRTATKTQAQQAKGTAWSNLTKRGCHRLCLSTWWDGVRFVAPLSQEQLLVGGSVTLKKSISKFVAKERTIWPVSQHDHVLW